MFQAVDRGDQYGSKQTSNVSLTLVRVNDDGLGKCCSGDGKKCIFGVCFGNEVYGSRCEN